MSDQPPSQGQGTDPEASRIRSLDDRFGAIEAEQQRQGTLLERIAGQLGGAEQRAHGAAQRHEERKLDAPTDVADEVRRQLEERDRAERARADQDQAAQSDQAWRAGVDTKLAELTEKPPEAPVRRVEKLLGWR